MVEPDSTRALQRINAALDRLEGSIHRIENPGNRVAADDTGEALAALQARHHALREAVKMGLGQLDGLLAEINPGGGL